MHHDSSRRPPRSHRGSPPLPESPCGTQPPPRVMGHPWDADRDGGSGRSGICVQRRKQGRRLQERFLHSRGSDDRAVSASVPLSPLLPGGTHSRTPHATTPPPQRSPVPPVRHHAELRARWLQPQSLHNSRASLAPGSGRHSLSGPSTPVPSSAAKAAAPCHPRPARPLSQPGFPASCAATAARDPPPSRLPLSCLFRSTNNFCSDAGSLGPRRPLLPASPPSGYENSKQLADLRADQLRLPPTPAFRSNPAAAASKISLRAGLGGGGDFSGRGCLRSKEPLRAHSSPLK